MQLSKNFSSEEFTKTPYEMLPKMQQLMLQNITNNILQPIRDVVGKSISITSGVRTIDDYNRLKANGWFPSESSDHFYGIGVPIEDPTKILLYGKTYFYSVGAADFKVTGMTADEVFKVCVQMVKEGKIDVCQLIHEFGNGEWVHVSNPRTLIYSSKVENIMKKEKFLISDDGGKTYKPYIA